MRFLRPGVVLALSCAATGCAGLGQSCTALGLTPGSPEYQRCEAASASRQTAGISGAVDAIRTIDVRGRGAR